MTIPMRTWKRLRRPMAVLCLSLGIGSLVEKVAVLGQTVQGQSSVRAALPEPATLGPPQAPPRYQSDSQAIKSSLSSAQTPLLGPAIRELPTPRIFPPDEESRVMPIDLGTALRLTETNNLTIRRAREAFAQSGVALQQARAQILPTLNMGSTYTHHEGKIQKTEGNIITANKDSLFVGLGPALTMNFSEALFAPLVAQQLNVASLASLRSVHNDTLQAVAEAYFAVLRARRRLARVDVALEYLVSDQPSPLRAGSKGLLRVVDALQKAGAAEALKAEVHRVQIEVLRRQEERTAALQEFRVAVAELARLLRLDPGLPLWPMEDFREPVELPGPWFELALEDLVRLALNNRPELAERQALVQAAVERVRTAHFRPFLPNLVLNYSWGDFGGGPDPNPPVLQNGKLVNPGGFGPSGRLLHFGTRTDFDVTLVWKLQNLGVGNYLEVRQQESLARQANLRLLQLQDQVITQVVQAQELVKRWEERIAITRSAMFDASGKPSGPVFEALRQNFQRIREVEKTRPLEVLDSIRSLSDLLEAYGQSVTDYERARFRLMIVLGVTPAEILTRLTPGHANSLPAPAPPPR